VHLFTQKRDHEKIGNFAFAFENFLPENVCKQYLKQLDDKTFWKGLHANYTEGGLGGLEGNLSRDMHLFHLWDNIINLGSPEFWALKHFNFTRYTNISTIPFTSVKNDISVTPPFKMYYYLGEWTGGELAFSNGQDTALYTPPSNTLVVMDANQSFSFAPVTSGIKYVYTDFWYPHPGWITG
jgi:hypothetical protein